jgi:hypothetical protein
MLMQTENAGVMKRPAIIGYLSLFTSISTLFCCALPSLLVLLGLGASVASALSFMPWLVTLSRHKTWVFGISGTLIFVSFIQTYAVSARLKLKIQAETCAPDDPSCGRAARFSKVTLWIAATIYLVGCFTAFALGPILTWIDSR